MSKILVSWVATGHDFLRKNRDSSDFSINENGPHYSLYRDFGKDFDIHYLLSQYNENENLEAELKCKRLAGKLRNDFKKQVIVRYMSIDDILSIGTIKNKIDSLVKVLLKDMDVQVFVSSGTPSMQTAWYLMGCELFQRDTIQFFRRREARFIKDGRTPPKEYIKFDVSSYAGVTNARDNYGARDNNKIQKPFVTASLTDIYTKAIQLAGNDKTTVLIQGASGTGKVFLSNYIHRESNRKNKSILKINCGAFREEVLETKLFGYAKGAFSNATQLTTGLFERAKGGTVVMEDIEKLPLRLQIRLTSVLGKKAFQRIGSNRDIDMDVRIIAITTEDLYVLRDQGVFHKELHYRLAIAELQLPSFYTMSKKERKQWVGYFMETTYTKLEVDYIEHISKEAWDFILQYPFLGNLKEVSNMVEVFYTFCKGKITLKDIPKQMIRDNKASVLRLDAVIKKHVQQVTERCGGNKNRAASLLGIDRATVRKYVK
ncbi:sigma 54-interacting transcriptional regulator [uncultured Lacinutrix sp.]|uniref:sigma-54-dependent transcriptional regulator n=1 Tax=uncultured Lacinutrix sp. TaxID=574032 RepID=UPI0026078FE1|nr:sigma 54-interacting transcriptional regulator [uncultured Lacinutrix sp.]